MRAVEGLIEEVGQRGGRVTLLARKLDELQIGPHLAEAPWLQVREMLQNDHWTYMRVLRHGRRMKNYVHWLAQDVQPPMRLHDLRSAVTGGWPLLLRRLRQLGAERLVTVMGVRQWLALQEWALPPNREFVELIREIAPDAVLLTPVITGLTPETDYQKAAQALGVPTAVLIASWDNLTMKGTFQVKPEWVLVWNEMQVAEAERYHFVPRARVIPVGAPVFDDVFERHWLVDRREFCEQAGLDPARPYFVYAVSSNRMRGDETQIVTHLMRELRCAPDGQAVQLLVRPHPKNSQGWDGFALEGVRLWARPGFPDTSTAKSHLYNTLYHSAGMIGLNTSMFLEAAILGRPGLTFYSSPQAELAADNGRAASARHAEYLHFRYLLDGGFLEVVEDAPGCAAKMLAILNGRDDKQAVRQAFVQSFLRPAALDRPARQVAVEALEKIAGVKGSENKQYG
jgi:hypothetical protein